MSELPPHRVFECDDQKWVVWTSGASAYGTGTQGPAALEAVHFAHAAAPTVPLYEALLAAGRFWSLFDAELAALLRASVRVVDPSERPVRQVSRRGEGLL